MSMKYANETYLSPTPFYSFSLTPYCINDLNLADDQYP